MENTEKVNILVVDDLPEKLLVIETILEGLGENIIQAHSGRQALRHLLEREFAVILLDVNMPDLDGLETAALIRQRKQTADTPIIFITAFTDEVNTAQGYSLGAVDYIYSPVVPEILRTKVGVFVDLYKKTQLVKRQADERVALAREQAARAAAEEAMRRSSFLAEASRALNRSLILEEILQGLCRSLVPFMGDFSVITMNDECTGLRKSFIAWRELDDVNSQTISLGWAVLDASATEFVDSVLVSGSSQLNQERLGPPFRAILAPSESLGCRASGEVTLPARSVMGIPLEAGRRILGSLVVGTGTSGRFLGALDLNLAEDLAARAAIAIENARLYRDIQEDDRRKNEFLAMLAHELRNPLAPIRNSVELLQHSGPENHQDIGWATDVIARQVEQIVRLVDDLLDISRISGGKIELRMETVDVSHVVDHAVETSRPLIESRGQILDVELPTSTLWLRADKARLSQILANLLNNASKYTEEGGHIGLAVEVDDRCVVFHVRDTGMGIPPEMLTRVFDLFTQVDRTLDRSQGGLGIGLTVVHRLVELHGGTVQARSDGPGRGSEFTMRFPMVEGVEAPSAAHDQPDSRDLSPSHHVLIVDDNLDASRSLARLLRLSGHDVRVADDGAIALELVEELSPRCILLDIGLPGMDGYEVARQLRKRGDARQIVLVALTGYGREEDRKRSKAAGFDHHFVKPVDIDTLLSLLHSIPTLNENIPPASLNALESPGTDYPSISRSLNK